MSSAPQTQEKEVNGNVSNMDEQLRQVMSSTMTISPDIFEKLYLQPKGQVKGDLRKTFGNPTPLALIGFVVGLMPLSIQLMGWRGSGGGAIATTTDSIWFGGMLLILGGFLEFLLGNTFPFCVFMAYGCHFLTFATTTIPWFNAVAAYTNGASQTETPEFDAGFGFYTLSLAILSIIFLIVSVRTNAIFVLVFTVVVLGFSCATAGEWYLAQSNVMMGGKMFVITGGFFFVAVILGWYLLLAIMLSVMEMPGPSLPVFDLSTVVKPKKMPGSGIGDDAV